MVDYEKVVSSLESDLGQLSDYTDTISIKKLLDMLSEMEFCFDMVEKCDCENCSCCKEDSSKSGFGRITHDYSYTLELKKELNPIDTERLDSAISAIIESYIN